MLEFSPRSLGKVEAWQIGEDPEIYRRVRESEEALKAL